MIPNIFFYGLSGSYGCTAFVLGGQCVIFSDSISNHKRRLARHSLSRRSILSRHRDTSQISWLDITTYKKILIRWFVFSIASATILFTSYTHVTLCVENRYLHERFTLSQVRDRICSSYAKTHNHHILYKKPYSGHIDIQKIFHTIKRSLLENHSLRQQNVIVIKTSYVYIYLKILVSSIVLTRYS